ncbi:MAG: hypothetical protein GXX85_05270 [Ignavibacteria bacterium]|nr:hypothetical protein [Ignavibacteria bacterium]
MKRYSGNRYLCDLAKAAEGIMDTNCLATCIVTLENTKPEKIEEVLKSNDICIISVVKDEFATTIKFCEKQKCYFNK